LLRWVTHALEYADWMQGFWVKYLFYDEYVESEPWSAMDIEL
jgi:hypothetical protein